MGRREDRRRKTIERFRTILLERLMRCNNLFIELERAPGEEALEQEFMRELHTTKGEAAMMRLSAINTVTHRTEDLFGRWCDQGYQSVESFSAFILEGLDLIRVLIEEEPRDPATPTAVDTDAFMLETDILLNANSPGSMRASVEALILEGLAEADAEAEIVGRPPIAIESAQIPFISGAELPDARHPITAQSWPRAPSGHEPRSSGAFSALPQSDRFDPPNTGSARAPRAVDTSVRVEVEALRRQAFLLDEIGIDRAQIDHLLRESLMIERAWQQEFESLRKYTSQNPLGEQPRVEGVADLQNRLLEQDRLREQMRKHLLSIRASSFNLKLKLKALRKQLHQMTLVPLDSILAELPRLVRDLARAQGKKIHVEVFGAHLGVEAQTLPHVSESLVHLIRNCVDHGIETPEERHRSGKPLEGLITITVRSKGQKIRVELQDDGRGIDPDAILASAIKRGVIADDDAHLFDESALIELLFSPGFSTRERVSDVSGRGVGLDVVRQRIMGIGGAVEVSSAPGHGATFSVEVPLSLSISQALVIKVSSSYFALPIPSVREVLRLRPEQLKKAGARSVFVHSGEVIPLMSLGELFGFSSTPLSTRRGQPEETLVILLEDSTRRVGLTGCQIIGRKQLARRALDRFVQASRFCQGSAIFEGGKLVLFLDPFTILDAIDAPGGMTPQRAHAVHDGDAPRRQRRAPLVLVVEDSELIRDAIVEALVEKNYRIAEAVNGQDALEKIADEPPDVILTDLDMPILDGFGLLAAINATPSLKRIPTVVFTSRGEDEDRERALLLGASDYLVKDPAHGYQRLMATVRRLLEL